MQYVGFGKEKKNIFKIKVMTYKESLLIEWLGRFYLLNQCLGQELLASVKRVQIFFVVLCVFVILRANV